jgi:hypothetical protein
MMVLLGMGAASQAAAQVTFYEHDGFRGRHFSASRPVADFARFGFNDMASSVIVRSGHWRVCEHAGFAGRCVVLKPGRYRSLSPLGFNDRISSASPSRPHQRPPYPPRPPVPPRPPIQPR